MRPQPGRRCSLQHKHSAVLLSSRTAQLIAILQSASALQVMQAVCRADIKFLCFRQNLIKDASPIVQAAFKFALQDLYFNDNQLAEIPDLTGFRKLRRLEFSYNHEVRRLAPSRTSTLSAESVF